MRRLSISDCCKGFTESKIDSLRHRRRRRDPRGGFTIIELMIALMLSSVAISLVFISWKYISQHTMVHQRKSIFEAEANRIAELIATQIRKSPKVVFKSSSSVVIFTPDGNDTIGYEYVSESLKKNNVEIWNDDRRARISQFSIEKESAGAKVDSAGPEMLLLTVGLKDRFGDSSVFSLKVKAMLFPDQVEFKGSSARDWNF